MTTWTGVQSARGCEPICTAKDNMQLKLPKAASAYRKQIADGLSGDPKAAAKAHLILRDLLGPISLKPGRQPG